MPLTPLQRRVLVLLHEEPQRDTDTLAELTLAAPAEIERALTGLVQDGRLRGRGWCLGVRRPVVVVGGANMDAKGYCTAPGVWHTSNPGTSAWTPGGVGRNIAENLARLGTTTELVAAIGGDPIGEELVRLTEAAGVGMGSMIVNKAPTGVYLAVLDHDGELLVGVSDMTCTDQLSVRQLMACRDLLADAELLVLDGNLPVAVATWLLEFAAAAGILTVLDPVSVPKAATLLPAIAPERPVCVLTPNVEELAVFAGGPVADDPEALAAAAVTVHDLGVTHVWVRRGPLGSLLSSRDAAGPPTVHLFGPPASGEVVDVTGGGDAMTAGFVHAYVRDGDVVAAAAFGQATAALTVESAATVRPDLTPALVQARARLSATAPTPA